MAGQATGTTVGDPLEIGAVAYRIGAGGGPVAGDVGSVEPRVGGVGSPLGDGIGMYLHRSTDVAGGARRTAGRDPEQAGAMAVRVAASRDPIGGHVWPMGGIGLGTPVKGVDIQLIPHVALGAGDLGDAAGEVAAMATGAGTDVGGGRRGVAGGQPVGGRVRLGAVRGVGTPVIPPGTAGEGERDERRQPCP